MDEKGEIEQSESPDAEEHGDQHRCGQAEALAIQDDWMDGPPPADGHEGDGHADEAHDAVDSSKPASAGLLVNGVAEHQIRDIDQPQDGAGGEIGRASCRERV